MPADYEPGQGLYRDLNFPFNANQSTQVENCMAGNLVVQRESALAAGGFDENYRGAAYRFETEFCRRLIRTTGLPFYFAAQACILHLQAKSGGTRSTGNVLTSASGLHSVGDYYYAFRNAAWRPALAYSVRRFMRSLVTRYYLLRPWYIPIRILAESRGFCAAMKLLKQAPSTLPTKRID